MAIKAVRLAASGERRTVALRGWVVVLRGVRRSHHVDVDRVLVLDGEPVALVEPPGGAALQNVQAYGYAVGVRLSQQGAQHGRAEGPAPEAPGEVEILQPAPVLRPP